MKFFFCFSLMVLATSTGRGVAVAQEVEFDPTEASVESVADDLLDSALEDAIQDDVTIPTECEKGADASVKEKDEASKPPERK